METEGIGPSSNDVTDGPSTGVVRPKSGKMIRVLARGVESSSARQLPYIRPVIGSRSPSQPIPALRVSERGSCNFVVGSYCLCNDYAVAISPQTHGASLSKPVRPQKFRTGNRAFKISRFVYSVLYNTLKLIKNQLLDTTAVF